MAERYSVGETYAINNLIIPTVVKTLIEIRRMYPDNPTLVGLCDVASKKFKYNFDELLKGKYPILEHTSCELMHGELKRSKKISKKYWGLEHTWNIVNIEDHVFHIDITSSQFQDIFTDIPNVYVGKLMPKWYLPDSGNSHYGGRNKWFR